MAAVVWSVTRPASPETLYAQAKKLMESDDPDKHEEAYNGPINDLPQPLRQSGGRADRADFGVEKAGGIRARARRG